MIFSVDGIQWKYGCTVEKIAEMPPSEISGLMLDKTYFNDVLGMYLTYKIHIEVPIGRESEYAQLYAAITDPIGTHVCTVPYSGGSIQVNGRIENIKDVYVRMPKKKVHWKGIEFDIISNHPSKTYSLGTVLTRGVPPLPSETDVNVGEAYIYGTSGWEQLADAEDSYY